MKKLSVLFVALISFFVFYIQFYSYSSTERDQIISFKNVIEKKDDVAYFIVTLKTNSDIKQLLDKVIEFSDKNQIITITGINSNKATYVIHKNYIHMPYNSEFNYFNIVHGKKTFPSDDEKAYLTTVLNDSSSYDQIDFVDPENHEGYKQYMEFYTMSQYPIDDNPISEINVFFMADNQSALTQLLQKSSLAEHIANFDTDIFTIPDSTEKDNSMDINVRILSVCCIALCLLYICQFIKNKKEIMICKMMGYTNLQVTKHLFIKQLLLSVLVFLCVQALCYVLFVGQFRPVTYPFIKILINYLLLFGIAMIIIFIIMLMAIFSEKEVLNMKKRTRLHAIRIMSLGLKVVMMILIFPPLLSIAGEGIKYGKEGYHLIANKNDIIDQLYLSSYEMRDINFDFDKLLCILNEHGILYNDYSNYKLQLAAIEEMKLDTEIKPYVVVNKNYLKSQNLHEKNGKKIDIDSIENITFFVPEGIQIESTEEYYQGNCDIVELQNGLTYPVNDINNLYFIQLHDPIIILDPGVPSGGMYYLPIEKREEVMAALDQEGMGKIVSFESTNGLYQYRLTEVKNKFISFITVFMLYTIVIFIILYQNLYVYFVDRKKIMSMMYMHGYSWLYRHGDLLYQNLLMYLPVILYLYFIAAIKIGDVILIVLLTMMIEALLTYFMIHHYEVKNTAVTLKGGD